MLSYLRLQTISLAAAFIIIIIIIIIITVCLHLYSA